MATSQNGWTVLDTAPAKVTIPGTDIELRLRAGDVAYLLTRFAGWFHRNVERLDMPVSETPGHDDWGWAKRPVRGQTTGYSNHASGTAEDLNATQHPRGVKGTFTAAERRAIHAELQVYRDEVTDRIVIRWGEDYVGTVDGMHFEINADAAAVARVAKRLRETDAPKPKPAPAPTQEDQDMFIDRHPTGPYLVGVAGKRKVTKAHADALRAALGLKETNLGSDVLGEFPTFTEDGTVGGSTQATLSAILRQTAPDSTPPATP